MKHLIILIVICFNVNAVFPQDIIHLKNGGKIEAKVTEIGTKEIKSQETNFIGFSVNPKYGYDIFSEDLVNIYPAAEIDFYYNNMIFSSSFIYQEEFAMFLSPNKNYHYLDFYVGKYKDFGMLRLKLQAGTGIIFGKKRGELLNQYGKTSWFIPKTSVFEEVSYLNFDIPLQAGIEFIPSKYFAIGTDINLNLNPEKILCGAALYLKIGILKK